jgi:hypothetical protein
MHSDCRSAKGQMVEGCIRWLSRVFFSTIVVLFFLFSLALVVVGVWDSVSAALLKQGVLPAILRGVGLLTVALAVFEVGKFLAEEELLRERVLGSVREARYSLTKFVTLIIIVISIEAIVFIFEAKSEPQGRLLLPTLLLLTAIAALLALGIFQHLTRPREQKDRGGE